MVVKSYIVGVKICKRTREKKCGTNVFHYQGLIVDNDGDVGNDAGILQMIYSLGFGNSHKIAINHKRLYFIKICASAMCVCMSVCVSAVVYLF